MNPWSLVIALLLFLISTCLSCNKKDVVTRPAAGNSSTANSQTNPSPAHAPDTNTSTTTTTQPLGPLIGFFTSNHLLFVGNNSAHYCQIETQSEWIAAGGPASGAPDYPSIPPSMTSDGNCPLPKGFFTSQTQIFESNGSGHYCSIPDPGVASWLNATSTTYDVPQIPSAPIMALDGQCQLPSGFFSFNGGYLSNGRGHYCLLGSYQAWLASGGPVDVTTVPTLQAIPTSMISDGTCPVTATVTGSVSNPVITNSVDRYGNETLGSVTYTISATAANNTVIPPTQIGIGNVSHPGGTCSSPGYGSITCSYATQGNYSVDVPVQIVGFVPIPDLTFSVTVNNVAPPCGYLVSPPTLTVDKPLYSCQHVYFLNVQGDGNLVLYHIINGANTAIWSAALTSATTASMQANGNFTAHDANNNEIWQSGTGGNQGANLVVQDDGNMVIYDVNNHPLWATNTAGK